MKTVKKLAIVGTAAAAIPLGLAVAAAMKPTEEEPGPAGTVTIIITKPKTRGYAKSLPADVTFAVNGTALKGVPAPDMSLMVQIWNPTRGAFDNLTSATYAAVALNVKQTLTETFTASQLLTKTGVGWGTHSVKGWMRLTNQLGTWEVETAEAAFTLGENPAGTAAVTYAGKYPVGVTVTGTATKGVPAPFMTIYLDKFDEATQNWLQIASLPLGGVPLNTPQTLSYIDTEYGGPKKVQGRIRLSNDLDTIFATSPTTPTYTVGEAPTGTIGIGMTKKFTARRII